MEASNPPPSLKTYSGIRRSTMATQNNQLINNFRQKIQSALSENKPVVSEVEDSFSVDIDEAIINGVRDRPHLYDPRRFGYRNTKKRNVSFSAIGSQLNMTGYEVEMRWKFLRERFCREKRSIDASKRWRFYSQLTFLNGHIKCRTTANKCDSLDNNSDFGVQTPSGNDPDDCGTSHSITLEQHGSDENPHEEMSECSSQSLRNQSPPSKRRKTTNDDMIEAMRNVSQAIKSSLYHHPVPPELIDSEMAFGIAISHRLKKLSPKQSSLVQFRIQQLLYEVEFGE